MNIHDRSLLTDTPIVAVDLTQMEHNIHELARLAKEANVKLRPHTKTHKSPYIAQLQLNAGASGITVATLGEAEMMANAGITNILIAFPLVGEKKLQRFSQLLSKAELIVALDEYIVAKGLNDVGELHKRKIPIYVDVDTGLKRMGKSPEESIHTISEIAALPYIDIIGLMSHTGHAYSANNQSEAKQIAIDEALLLYETKRKLEKKGIQIKEISVGATATAKYMNDLPHITEMRAGMYVFNDRNIMEVGGASEAECALSIIATIVSKPSKERMIIDAGSKTLSSDLNRAGGYGIVKGYPNLTIERLSEEHGILTVKGLSDFQVGDVLSIIPNHVCPVVNLADELYGIRNGDLERMILVEGRGKNR